jgi:cytochrome c
MKNLTILVFSLICSSAASSTPPAEHEFEVTVLDSNLFEPMELDLLDDGRILFIERPGPVKIYDPKQRATQTIAEIQVFGELEEGLLGVAVDPDYAINHWVYFVYSAPVDPEIRVARFELAGSTLDLNSEKILLAIPVQRDQCCHVAGSIEFSNTGDLYISIGDNTNPHESNGFTPIDERIARGPWDAQKSSANTNDLRGKILRIRPNSDGTYSIPEGNLFPSGAEGRPEIYVMGNRNPFRFSIDTHTGYLYWGEVGPDANTQDPARGPSGHDEINQAKRPGNFGWPYFVANNKPYKNFDFSSQMATGAFTATAPVNDSPNNTGARVLPPAQPAFIWYPYGPSTEFPLVGTGGRNAMAGPVFHHADYAHREGTFPKYYDGKLFTYDWMRGWIMAVTLDTDSNFVEMERFMPGTQFSRPTDMLFGPNGDMYLLEYGNKWYQRNEDARLVRIRHTQPFADK